MDRPCSSWIGQLVSLRTFEPSDWKAYSEWNQDAEQSRALYFIPFPRSQELDREWAEAEARRERQSDDFRFTIQNRDGQVVGDLTVHQSDRRTGTFSYGISIAHDHAGAATHENQCF